jgi:ABC-type nitrate/sulfonate/bicarbonate transport system substrate-binding protein
MRTVTHILPLLFTILLCGCGNSVNNPMSLVFMAGYKPQANLPFVGVYVAQEKGYFADENLNVEIQHSAGRGEHLQLLVAGTVDVTTQDAGVLLKRRAEPGLPLVSIGLIGQKGQQAFVALQSSGINTVDDWHGRKIGFKGTPPPDLLAIIDKAGYQEDDVELINVGFDPRVLIQGLVDIYPVYNSNEPYILRSLGYELTQWDAGEFGVPTMGLAYVSTPEIIDTKPRALNAFIKAVIRGIEYAEKHPEEAIDIVMLYTGPETDREHMFFMMQTEIEDAHSALTSQHGLGWQTSEQWQSLLDTLLRYEAIPGSVDVDLAFTNQFLTGD